MRHSSFDRRSASAYFSYCPLPMSAPCHPARREGALLIERAERAKASRRTARRFLYRTGRRISLGSPGAGWAAYVCGPSSSKQFLPSGLDSEGAVKRSKSKFLSPKKGAKRNMLFAPAGSGKILCLSPVEPNDLLRLLTDAIPRRWKHRRERHHEQVTHSVTESPRLCRQYAEERGRERLLARDRGGMAA